MANYSVGYPIYINVQTGAIGTPIRYAITGDDGFSYTGTVYPKVANEVVKVDISPILRQKVDTIYEEIPWDRQNSYESGSRDFAYPYHYHNDPTNYAIYNYNSQYISTIPNALTLTQLISNIVDPRQYFTPTNMADFTVAYEAKTSSGVTLPQDTGDVDPGGYLTVFLFGYDLSKMPVKVGEKIIFSGVDGITVDIVSPCLHTHCLYYVNKSGGLDWLLVNVKTSWKADDKECRFASDRLNSKDFERRRIHSDVTRSFRIFTDNLTDDEASRMDNAFFAPKMWLMDLESRFITSVVITDREFTENQYRSDNEKMGYEFTVEESQRFIRR